jgi:hypothetical protein
LISCSTAAAAGLAAFFLQYPLLHDSKQVLPAAQTGWVCCVALALGGVNLDVA